MFDFSNSIKSNFRLADSAQKLLFINIGVFAISRILAALSQLLMVESVNFGSISYWLAVPANLSSLLFRPWTIITYMFYHWDFFHLFFNMLLLYWMGNIFQSYLGEKKLISTYIIGGVCGAIVYIAAYNIFPLFSNSLGISFALGASASVLAITVAAATLLPDFPVRLFFIGEVKLKWIAVLIVISDLISIGGANAGGHLAHLGGALYGFIYIRRLRSGNDIAARFDRVMDFISRRRKPKMKVSHRGSKSDAEFIQNKQSRQEKIDLILDKISKSGYGSLSQDEKDYLFRSSKEN